MKNGKLKTYAQLFRNTAQGGLTTVSVMILVFSSTTFSVHTPNGLEVDFNKEITPLEVEEIVDRELQKNNSNRFGDNTEDETK
ncbi:MAG: hypothetical protein QNJ38_01195 [Prochloraceae cyanobacterium]|nr:hypothetical protein [Prochloraceae cyanobacterium]